LAPKKLQTKSTPRREEILTAAAAVFAEKGFNASTTREIGERASILSGSLYYYFPTKEQMALEIVGAYLTELKASYEEIVRDETTPTDQLRRLVDVSLEVSSRRPNEVTILYQDWLALNNVDGSLDRWMTRIEKLWRGVVDLGIERGEFRDDLDSRLVFRTIMGAISWVPRWFKPRGPAKITDVARVQAELVLNGLRRA
jgi:AcrR family transcriptional regulator